MADARRGGVQFDIAGASKVQSGAESAVRVTVGLCGFAGSFGMMSCVVRLWTFVDGAWLVSDVMQIFAAMQICLHT